MEALFAESLFNLWPLLILLLFVPMLLKRWRN